MQYYEARRINRPSPHNRVIFHSKFSHVPNVIILRWFIVYRPLFRSYPVYMATGKEFTVRLAEQQCATISVRNAPRSTTHIIYIHIYIFIYIYIYIIELSYIYIYIYIYIHLLVLFVRLNTSIYDIYIYHKY